MNKSQIISKSYGTYKFSLLRCTLKLRDHRKAAQFFDSFSSNDSAFSEMCEHASVSLLFALATVEHDLPGTSRSKTHTCSHN